MYFGKWKKTKAVLACILAAAIAVSPAGMSRTEAAGSGQSSVTEESASGKLLYQTDFSNADDWTTYNGWDQGVWSVEDHKYTVSPGRGNKAIVNDKSFTDFTYEADVTVNYQQSNLDDKSSAQGGILFRVTEPMDNHGDGYHGYYFWIDAHNGRVALGKVEGTLWTEIASKKMTVKYGKPYHLSVKVSGNHIVCDVNADETHYAKLDVVDSSHSEGSIGLRNWLASATYENVKVTSYQEQPLEGETYQNPILPNCADPDILYHNGTYYLYPTNAGDSSQGIKVYTSTDLVNWTDKGYALKKEDVWGEFGFWAPDIIERDGIFYMYYTAEEQICVATSDSPLGPYTQDVKKPMHTNVKEIDAHVFQDDDGAYYFYFVRFGNGNRIFGAKLNDDMKSIDESSITELLVADTPWEQDMGNINEGPFMLKKDGVYYLTYSGAHFESPGYGSGYAVSDSPLGEYRKYENNPIMQSNTLAHGTGHHGITVSPDGTEMFMVYHCHNDLNNTEPRRFCIDRLQFTEDEDGKTVLEVKGPTVTPQSVPSGAVNVNNLISFEEPELETVIVDHGSDPASWGLPETVEGIVTSKCEPGASYTGKIVWDTTAYNPKEEGRQVLQITGTIELPEGIENLGNLPLSLETEVVVQAKKLTTEKLDEAVENAEKAQKEAEEARKLAESAQKEADRLASEAKTAQAEAEAAQRRAEEMADASLEEREKAEAEAEEASQKAQEAARAAELAGKACREAQEAKEKALARAESFRKEAEQIRAKLSAVQEEIRKEAEEIQKQKEEAQRQRDEAQKSAKAAEEALKKLQEKRQNEKKEPEAETLEKGSIFSSQGLRYRVTDAVKKTVTVLGAEQKNKKTLVIPAKAGYKGETYKVTAIEKKAFWKNKKLKTVTIGKNVQVIGKQAFYQDTNLKSIKVQSRKLTKVGKKAFQGISKKALIQVKGKEKRANREKIKKSKLSGAVRIQ